MFIKSQNKKTVIQVWNDMRVCKWWQNINFGWTTPCKTQTHKTTKKSRHLDPWSCFILTVT